MSDDTRTALAAIRRVLDCFHIDGVADQMPAQQTVSPIRVSDIRQAREAADRLAAPVGEKEKAEPDSAEWWRQVAQGVAFDYHTLRQLVYALQAHAKDCGWQDVDEPIASLLAWRRHPETETNVEDGGDGGD